MRLIALSLLTATLSSAPALAKEYNSSTGVPPSAQATINRIMAEAAQEGKNSGDVNAFESDCADLKIGTGNENTEEQIIVADQIINAGGQCRVRGGLGAFSSESSEEQEFEFRD